MANLKPRFKDRQIPFWIDAILFSYRAPNLHPPQEETEYKNLFT